MGIEGAGRLMEGKRTGEGKVRVMCVVSQHLLACAVCLLTDPYSPHPIVPFCPPFCVHPVINIATNTNTTTTGLLAPS